MEPIRRRKNQARPYPSQRIGAAHRAMRARLEPVVATGRLGAPGAGS